MLDFAFETEAGKSIKAGDPGNPPVEASKVEKVHLTVVDLSEEAIAVGYQFVPAPDERAVGEYRVMVVEADLAERFDLKVAREMGAQNYVTVSTGREFYSGVFAPEQKSISGQALRSGAPYFVAVLSIPPEGKGNSTLSPLSNLIRFVRQEDAILEAPVVAEQQKQPVEEEFVPSVSPRSAKPAKDYPKLRKGKYRLYSAGSTITFKSELSEVDPESTITVYTAEGYRLAGKRFGTPETQLKLDHLPEGVYKVKLNVNGTLIHRDMYIR